MTFDLDLRFAAWRQRMAHASGLPSPFHVPTAGPTRDTVQVDGRDVLCFAGYNYLGLCGHPAVNAAAHTALDAHGSSACASRVLSGDKPPHRALELALADFLGTDDALTFVSGHATNVSTLAALLGPPDLVAFDALAHDSILQGIRLSGAQRLRFPHNDLEALARRLRRARPRARRCLIAVEGIYSADGDAPDLPALLQIARDHQAWVLVDEAHSLGTLGTTGRGLAEHHGVDPREVDLWMGTLSKTLASCGGYIAGSSSLVTLLRNRAPGFVFSVGMPPPAAAAAHAALDLLAHEPARVRRLHANRDHFLRRARAEGFQLPPDLPGPVVPIEVGSGLRCVQLAQRLAQRDLLVSTMVWPSVPPDRSRLRLFITADHTPHQLDTALQHLLDLGAHLPEPPILAPEPLRRWCESWRGDLAYFRERLDPDVTLTDTDGTPHHGTDAVTEFYVSTLERAHGDLHPRWDHDALLLLVDGTPLRITVDLGPHGITRLQASQP